ncbi:hypothetical protein TNCV_1911921 [Trichonephila clavipes]|nr:hypothetical protein TNCV_1911921 [Trichonephila clavipes]
MGAEVHVQMSRSYGQSEASSRVFKSRTTRGLLVTDHVILNHGQVTWTTPELDYAMAMGGSFSLKRLNVCSHHSTATRGLLATDHVILNHGQVTWTTPELEPPSPNYHTTPTGERFSSRQI